MCFQPHTRAAGLAVSRIFPLTCMDIKLSLVEDFKCELSPFWVTLLKPALLHYWILAERIALQVVGISLLGFLLPEVSRLDACLAVG